MQEHLQGAAAVSTLFLALLILLNARGRGSLPAFLLCLSLFVWTAGVWAFMVSGAAEPFYVGLAGASMAPAFFFHFVASIVRTRRAVQLLAAFYGVSGAFALLSPAALVVPKAAEFVDSTTWNWVYLGVMLPLIGGGFYLLVRGAAVEPHAGRRRALRWILAAAVVATAAGLTDVTDLVFGHGVRIGSLGAISCAALFAVATIRERFLGVALAPKRILSLVLLAFAGLVMFFTASMVLRDRWDLLTVVSLWSILFVLAGFQRIIWDWRDEVDTLRRLASLGEMAASVAHEVRNPLSAIRGATQLLDDPALPAEKRAEYLALMRSEIDALNRVVEEFQEFSRPLELRFQPVDLGVYLERLAELFRAGAPKGVTVVVERDGEIPPVPADPDALRHALWNLMKNGVEAMAERGGTLKVRARSFHEAVSIEILDEGGGIPPEDLERLFEPFRSVKRKGSGLGLAIARRLTEAHGGRIVAENRPEGGARMTVLLPRGR